MASRPPPPPLYQEDTRLKHPVPQPLDVAGTEGDGVRELLFFRSMFPLESLQRILEATNKQLGEGAALDEQEFWRFLGLLLAMTVAPRGKREDFWDATSEDAELFPPSLFSSIMSHHRFEEILSSLRLDMYDEAALATEPWIPIRKFLEDINQHRARHILPSGFLVQDEAMSAWHGRYWHGSLQLGLPHRTVLPEKPEPVGLCLRVVADGQTGIALAIEIEEGKEAMATKDFVDTTPTRACATMARMTQHLAHLPSGHRLLLADSYFGSVGAASYLWREHKLLFTGVVKHAHKFFPRDLLLGYPYRDRGDWVCYEAVVDGVRMLACGWKDLRVMTYVTTHTTCEDGMQTSRQYTCMPEAGSPLPHKVEVHLSRPELVQHYHDFCSAVDIHNHLRQGGLQLERVLHTHTWWVRSFSTLLGMIEVDAYLAYRYQMSSLPSIALIDHTTFTRHLAIQLVRLAGSTGLGPVTRASLQAARKQAAEGTGSSQRPLHNIRALETLGPHRPKSVQLKCRVCHKHTTHFCLTCFEKSGGKDILGVCSAEKGHAQCVHTHSDRSPCE